MINSYFSQIDIEHGLSGILLSLIGIIALQLISYVAKAVWAFINRNKGPSKAQFIELARDLKAHSELLHEQKTITSKVAQDIRRVYLFLKVIAGDKWPKYKRMVEEIEKEDRIN